MFTMSVFYERINELCKESGEKLTPLLQKLGMSAGNIARWKNGTVPYGDSLTKLADYFGVSTDYLLGKTEKRQAPEGLTAKRVLSELFFSNGFFGYTRKHRQG